MLRALGWNMEDLDEVQREYKSKRRDKPVDYGLLLMRTPRLFIEAKALHQDLGDRRWSNQIMGYAAVAGVEWVVLTNGDEYRIYNAHAAVAVDEKLFRQFRVSAEDGVAEATLPLLGRERMEENRLQVLWKTEVVDRQVKAALDEMFEPGDDAAVVKLLQRKTRRPRAGRDPRVAPARAGRGRLPGGDRRGRVGLGRRHLPVPSPGSRGRPTLRLAKGQSRRRAVVGVSTADLIRAGLLKPPVELRREYRGAEVRATIVEDGTVVVDGERAGTLSKAADLARAKVLGARGEKATINTNGWTFWRLADEAGKAVPVDELRKAFLAAGRRERSS